MKKQLLSILSVIAISASATAQSSWVNNVNQGFGNTNNTDIIALNTFKGELYATTGPDSGYVYKTSSGISSSWTKTFSDNNSNAVEAIGTTAQGGGFIYISSYNQMGDSTIIYRSPDGVTWTPYFNVNGYVQYIIPFKGAGTVDSIYIVQNFWAGGAIYKSAYDSNDPTNSSSSWVKTLDLTVQASIYTNSTSAFVYNNTFYVGTNNGAMLWSSTDGINWMQNANVGNGFGNGSNNSLSAITAFGGYLYVGTENNSGSELWKSNDDVTWTLVNQFNQTNRITNLNVIGTEMWIALEDTYNNSGGKISRTSDGAIFTYSMSDGFGITGSNGVDGLTAQFGNNIYYSCQFTAGGGLGPVNGLTISGAQIWKYCTATPPSVNAGPDQIVCDGVAHTFDAGAGYLGYEWNDGSTNQTLTVSTAGNYTVQVVGANGCENTDVVNLSTTPSPTSYLTYPMYSPLTLCKNDTFAIGTISSSNLRMNLPPIHKAVNDTIWDFVSVLDTINVSGIAPDDGAGTTLLSVTIDSLYHPNDGELSIVLHSPDGSAITLSNNNGYGGSNYIGTNFTMNGAPQVYTSSPPYTGEFTPVDGFYYLNGATNGNWVLEAYDNQGGNIGVIKGWSISFSQQDTVLTYSWIPSMGLSSSSIPNPIVTGTNTIPYVMKVTNTIGCSSYDSLTVIVPALTITPNPATVCFGDSLALTATGGNVYYWSPSTALSDTLGAMVMTNTSANIMYFVRDTISGCAVKDSVNVSANPMITINAGIDQTICFADTANFTAMASGGTGAFSYLWDDGTSTYNTQNILVSPLTNKTYTLKITDAVGCSSIDTTQLNITPSVDIYGKVTYSGGNVIGSSVVLLRYRPFFAMFDTVRVTTTNALGDYHFSIVNHGTYIVEVFPSGTYPTLVPTYYGDNYLWDSATVANHFCNLNDTLNIAMTENTGTGGGTGLLQGTIIEAAGFGRNIGDPIPGVDVKLGKNPGGQLIASTSTGSNGMYNFTNLVDGNYTIYVDIPGLGRDSSYTLTLSGTDNQFTGLNYTVDSTTIFIDNSTLSISNNRKQTEKFDVYPNPTTGNATISFNINSEQTITIAIYNVLGIKVADVVNTTQSAGEHKYKINTKNYNLNAGIYFVTLISNGKTSVQRLVISE